jgi:tRNA (guanine-N7-)-methyltransferase
MPRRSPRKIDPALDLSRHLLGLDDLERPWNAVPIFGRAAPLEVELGTGKGLFLAAAAAGDPEGNYLGLEISAKYARFAAARLARQGLNNACVVHADGVQVFREVLPDESCRAVHVYFPDPWWKARHRKRRVMRPQLLADVERTLAPGGRLHFWTDVEEYFRTTLELIAATTRLRGPWPEPERPAAHDLDYRTHFERRMRQHGQPVFRAEFRRPAEVPAAEAL